MAQRIQISVTELRRLYLDEYLTPAAIAKRVGCSSEGIRAILRREKISLRNSSQARRIRLGVSCAEFRDWYIDKHLSAIDIADRLNCSETTIGRRLRECGIELRKDADTPLTYLRHNFDGDEYLKAYMIGFRQGDLRVTFGKKGGQSRTVRVEMSSTKEEQLKLFHQLFASYGHVWEGKRRRSGRRDLACNLNLTFDFLLPKQDRVEKWIFESDECMTAFVAGYIDAEGSFGFNKGDPQFAIDSYDRGIQHSIFAWLVRKNVECPAPHIARRKGSFNSGAGVPYSSDLWRLAIYRKRSLEVFIHTIEPYIRHAKRRSDMMRVLKHLERNKREGEQNV